jgi:hypothetical protein
MTYHFRKAISSEAKPLVGLYAESGGGKTYSALLLACGFVDGDMSKVGMIETESGRGEAWADDPVIGGYQVLPLRDNFAPSVYGKAIAAAFAGEFRALIVDSASHEWEGVGGVCDMAAKNKAGGKKGVLVWQEPKMEHAREFMLRLTQGPTPLIIVCMRARYAMEEVSEALLARWDRPGKRPSAGDWVRSSSLTPKQSDDILSEMFVHGWLDKDEHRFHLTKDTVPAMRQIFIDNEAISVETGKRLAAWTAGRAIPGQYISTAQQMELEKACKEAGIPIANLLARAKVERLDQILSARLDAALQWIGKQTPTKPVDAETATLRKIDGAKDRDTAGEILDAIPRDSPLYARASEAYVNRWGAQ